MILQLIMEDEQAASALIGQLRACDFAYDALIHLCSLAELKGSLQERVRADLLICDFVFRDGFALPVFLETGTLLPVIFLGSQADFQREIYKANTLAYLSKPVEGDALAAALCKFLSVRQWFQHHAVSRSL